MKDSNLGLIAFGPFRLNGRARVIDKDGVPLAIGARALDILIVLVERAGEVVSHKELISRVWRGLVVDPANLRVHMTALRRLLEGDGEKGRYIANVPGQGYCFVAPVRGASNAASMASQLTADPTPSRTNYAVPQALARMIGRTDVIRSITADLLTDRFVTIIGPGGMGKTTVAVAVAQAARVEFDDKVCFVDAGAVADPKLLATTVASTLGLAIPGANPIPTLMSFLRTARILLVLDNCEHLIDAAASLAEAVFSQAPDVYLLATSREALRVEGEHAHRLPPLESPPAGTVARAAEAMRFDAVKLFVERARAGDSGFALTDANAAIVADICGRLDGIALALELVAGRVGTYGLAPTRDLLNQRLSLHWKGRRTALPRHQTLHALLEWSFGLLTATEQHVLRNVSVLVGPFALDAAAALCTEGVGRALQVADALEQLILKSMVAVVDSAYPEPRYRLLETTRHYARMQLEERGEADIAAERHARYLAARFASTPAGVEDLGNLRAALEWCFEAKGESKNSRPPGLGVDLAVSAMPTLLQLSLWNECIRWSREALSVLPESARGGSRELVLQEALGIASLLTLEKDARSALDRGMEIARERRDLARHFRLLGALHVYLLRMTDFTGALTVAEEMKAVALQSNDPGSLVIADWMLGSSHYVLGHPATAKRLFESGFSSGGDGAAGRGQQLAGLHYRTRALYGLARVQWLCGFPDQALASARQDIAEAAESGSPFNVSYSMVYCCYVFLWCGDLDAAESMVGKVMAQPHWEGRLVWFHAEALALRGELLVRRGRVEEGIRLLRRAWDDMLGSSQKNLMQATTACALAEALTGAGRAQEALGVVDDAIAHSPDGTQTWDGPELLRVRANTLLSMPQGDLAEAERCLRYALSCAREQEARGWELRSLMTLARLQRHQGRKAEARNLLTAAYEAYTEGFETPDLEAARQLLDELR